MKSIVHGAQPCFENVCIDLRSRQIRVSKHDLNRPKIRPPLEQMRREGVSEHVRAQLARNARPDAVVLQHFPESHARQRSTVAGVDEQPR